MVQLGIGRIAVSSFVLSFKYFIILEISSKFIELSCYSAGRLFDKIYGEASSTASYYSNQNITINPNYLRDEFINMQTYGQTVKYFATTAVPKYLHPAENYAHLFLNKHLPSIFHTTYVGVESASKVLEHVEGGLLVYSKIKIIHPFYAIMVQGQDAKDVMHQILQDRESHRDAYFAKFYNFANHYYEEGKEVCQKNEYCEMTSEFGLLNYTDSTRDTMLNYTVTAREGILDVWDNSLYSLLEYISDFFVKEEEGDL
ncbi:MAG: hypothetical protein ACI8ZF_000393 [Candidatus Midichloriaceae bacterium]|jgi:hypothetical protein